MAELKPLPELREAAMTTMWRLGVSRIVAEIDGLGHTDRAGWAFCALLVGAALRHPSQPPAYLAADQLLDHGCRLLDELSEVYGTEAVLEGGASLLRQLVPATPAAVDVEEAGKN